MLLVPRLLTKQAVEGDVEAVAKKSQKSLGSLKRAVFDKNFISPMAEQKLGAEPGPEMFSTPIMAPPDPLKLVPAGGAAKGKISK